MTDGFPGDPGHEGGNQPMRSLKGTCSEVHTQAPMSGENSGNSMGGANDTTPGITGWTDFLASSGGSRGVGGHDSKPAST